MPKKATKTLTVQTLDSLKPDPSKRREIPDQRCPGLYHLIQPTGKRSWALRYRRDGRIVKYTIGDYPRIGLTEARDEANAILRRVDKGEDPQREKVAAKSVKIEEADPRLFENLVRLYLTRVARKKNKDWVEGARVLGLVPNPPDKVDDPMSFVLRPLRVKGKVDRSIADPLSPVAYFGQRLVSEIKRSDIRLLFDKVQARGLGGGINQLKSAISAVFSWALEKELIEFNPCGGIKKLARVNVGERTLDRDDEIRAVWRAATDIGGSYGAIVKVCLLSGQRRGEVAGMEWRELDMEKRTWSLPGARTKNKRPHLVPLSDAIMEVIEAQKPIDNSPYVFPGRLGTPVAGFSKYKARLDKKVTDHLRKMAEERGADTASVTMDRYKIHDLRRTFATRLGDLDIDPHVVEAGLNHASGHKAGVAGVYNKNTYARQKQVALDRWGEFVTSLVNEEASKVVPMTKVRA